MFLGVAILAGLELAASQAASAARGSAGTLLTWVPPVAIGALAGALLFSPIILLNVRRQRDLERRLMKREPDREEIEDPRPKGDNPVSRLMQELYRLESVIRRDRREARQQQQRWSRATILLGVPATFLAAAAGGLTAISKDYDIVRWIAVGSAALAAGSTAIATSLNAAKQAEQAAVTGTRLDALEDDARIVRRVDLAEAASALDRAGVSADAGELQSSTYEKGRAALQALVDRRNEIRGLSPSPRAFAVDLTELATKPKTKESKTKESEAKLT